MDIFVALTCLSGRELLVFQRLVTEQRHARNLRSRLASDDPVIVLSPKLSAHLVKKLAEIERATTTVPVERTEEETLNCWAMRTSRDSEEHRRFLLDELHEGRLHLGWGWDESQDLRRLKELWANGDELSEIQKQAGRHWRMGNGPGDDYCSVTTIYRL